MDNNKIIQSLWIGDVLSPIELLCINSYLQNDHEFHLYTYNAINNIPKGVKVNNANEIVNKTNIFLDSHNGFASFSDYFRYKLLFDKGGWWVDMDTVCLCYFDFQDEYCFATEKINIGKGDIVANTYIKSPSNSEFLKDCINYIEEEPFEEVIWGSFGPFFLTKVLELYDSRNYITPNEIFCPIPWYEINKLLFDYEYLLPHESRAGHLWNERWRIEKRNKYETYNPFSLFEKLKCRYKISENLQGNLSYLNQPKHQTI